jgi:hypothetical protein
VLFGNTEIHASDLSQYYKKLNEIGVNETTSIEEHFKVMTSLSLGVIKMLVCVTIERIYSVCTCQDFARAFCYNSAIV